MTTLATRTLAALLALATLFGTAPSAHAALPIDAPDPSAIGRTPPRLSYIDGEVSFWRPGAQDWSPAGINIPLAPGDELYTAHQGDVELQIGTRAFVRAWGDTQLGLANQEADFLQVKVTSGHVSIDVRSLDQHQVVEIDTPQAAFHDRPSRLLPCRRRPHPDLAHHATGRKGHDDAGRRAIRRGHAQ